LDETVRGNNSQEQNGMICESHQMLKVRLDYYEKYELILNLMAAKKKVGAGAVFTTVYHPLFF